LVNNTYVKTSSLSQRLAVANLADAFCAGSICAPGHELLPEISLLDLQKVLASKKFVDLMHDFAPGIPR
jgi:hypothetical protein